MRRISGHDTPKAASLCDWGLGDNEQVSDYAYFVLLVNPFA